MSANLAYLILFTIVTLCLAMMPISVLLAFCSDDWRWFTAALPGLFLFTQIVRK